MLTVRQAIAQDEDFLRECIFAAYKQFPKLIAQRIDQVVDNEYEHIFFAEIATEIENIGAAWWVPLEDKALQVAYYVKPEKRGQGIATKLIETGLERAKNSGYRSITIKTHRSNESSVALAKKLGFEPVVEIWKRSF